MSRKAWLIIGMAAIVMGAALVMGILSRGPAVPARPAQVPVSAEWAGSGSRGRFFIVEGRQGSTYTIAVFEAGSGAKHPATKWKLVGFARTSLGVDEIQGMEGQAILLTDGSKLLPAE